MRPLDANLVRARPGGGGEGHELLRGAHRLEVLRQPDGQRLGRLCGQARLHALPLRRRIVRHGLEPRAREGRDVGGARVALDSRREERGARRAARLRVRHCEGALGDVRAELLRALRLRGRRQGRSDQDDGGDGGAGGCERHRARGRLHAAHARRVCVHRPRRRLCLPPAGHPARDDRWLAHCLPPLGHGRRRSDRAPLPREVRGA
mmetsp:Transcript_1104/g.3494  ORF Transcript_1104/g.3494 Transcript_1104/m.3494 type:complete len:206 (-) Transcript_1104:225-842(-)